MRWVWLLYLALIVECTTVEVNGGPKLSSTHPVDCPKSYPRELAGDREGPALTVGGHIAGSFLHYEVTLCNDRRSSGVRDKRPQDSFEVSEGF